MLPAPQHLAGSGRRGAGGRGIDGSLRRSPRGHHGAGHEAAQARQSGAQPGDVRGQRADRGPAGLQRGGGLDQAQLGEGAGHVAGVEQEAGGVGDGAGTALGGEQTVGAQPAGVGEGGVDVAEVAVSPARPAARSAAMGRAPASRWARASASRSRTSSVPPVRRSGGVSARPRRVTAGRCGREARRGERRLGAVGRDGGGRAGP